MSTHTYMYSSTDVLYMYKCHTCSVATLEVIINKSKLYKRAHIRQLWLHCHDWGLLSTQITSIMLACWHNVWFWHIVQFEGSWATKTLNFIPCTTHICGQAQCTVGIECDMQDNLTIVTWVCSSMFHNRMKVWRYTSAGLKQWKNSLARRRKLHKELAS